MPFLLYLITENDIIPVVNPKSITLDHIVAVSDDDSKAVYIWKGVYSPNFDTFKAAALYERILNRFVNPNVYIIKDLEILGDTDPNKKVKEFLIQNLPNQKISKWNHVVKEVFLLKSVRRKVEEFNRYESSSKWRAKLSNLTNLRRLSIFNVISIISVIVILILKIALDLMGDSFIFLEGSSVNTALWNLWLSALIIIMIICSILLSVVVVINMGFIMFPMKFPINPKAMDVISYRTTDALLEYEPKLEQFSGIKQGEGIKLPPAAEIPKTASEGSTTQDQVSQSKIKINLQAPKLPPAKGASIAEEQPNIEKIYENDEDANLDIPKVPMRKTIKVKTKDLEDQLILEEESESSEIKTILVECEICKKTIKMPVPKKVITESKLPVTDVTYIHGEPAHALTAQLDKDYQVRRQRSAAAIFQDKAKGK
jgi:hypothetical protein